MFSRKCSIIFISRQRIDSISLVASHGGFIRLGEVVSYPYEGTDFSSVFRKMAPSLERRIRVVLSEELVYVTGFSFPSEQAVTRDLVLGRAEESVPEHLRTTDWDFRTLRYATKQERGMETLVQVAVVEHSFSEHFRQALLGSSLRIEGVFPKSCVFADLEKESAGVSVIVEQDQNITTFCGAEGGFVIAVHIEHGEMTPEKMGAFIHFLSVYKRKEARRIVLSHCVDFTPESMRHFFSEKYEVEEKELDTFIGAASQKKVSGKDEDVLNIDMFSSFESRPWWKRFGRAE